MFKNCFGRSLISKFERSERRRSAIHSPSHYDVTQIKTIQTYPKSPHVEELLRTALKTNEFLAALLQDEDRLQRTIDTMQRQTVTVGQELIIEHTIGGSHLYISTEGTFEILQDNKCIDRFSDVRVFGELALLYDARRLATIRATTTGCVYALDRTNFKHLMVQTAIEQHRVLVDFLRLVPSLKNLGERLDKLADLLHIEFYSPGTKIIREGESGEKFFIVKAGSVSVSRRNEGIIGRLERGTHFGELALLGGDTKRRATVTALPPGVECLVLNRHGFQQYLSDDANVVWTVTTYDDAVNRARDHQNIELDKLERVCTLGVGGFGRVDLVRHPNHEPNRPSSNNQHNSTYFALKRLKKHVMIVERQTSHVYNEKEIQITCHSPFIVRLYRTYRDAKYLYLLLEPCMGGDLWRLMHRQHDKRFTDSDARFYVACTSEALAYLHQRGIVYRDLKPENLLIDQRGYVKLTDLGFARQINDPQSKLYTFVGTPQYIAPEIILNRGYNQAIDYYALGVLTFELLTGRVPFSSNDPNHIRTYKMILRGIDTVTFPPLVTPRAKNFVRKLCKVAPAERLGTRGGAMGEVREHRWFAEMDWEALLNGRLIAPHKPTLKSADDVRYFEKFSPDTEIPPDDLSGWDEGF